MILYLFFTATMTCSKMAAVILANLPALGVMISVQGRGQSKGWVTFTWSECLPVASCIIVWSSLHLCDDWNQFAHEAKWSRACVTYNFPLAIQIWQNFYSNYTDYLVTSIFAHDMTAMLSWHVQKMCSDLNKMNQITTIWSFIQFCIVNEKSLVKCSHDGAKWQTHQTGLQHEKLSFKVCCQF